MGYITNYVHCSVIVYQVLINYVQIIFQNIYCLVSISVGFAKTNSRFFFFHNLNDRDVASNLKGITAPSINGRNKCRDVHVWVVF